MEPHTDISSNLDTETVFDPQRRFGGLDRLYGPQTVEALARGQVVVAGIGGVGTWCVEALARSGIGALTLIDLDHIAESNINRQAHALESTLGQAKVQAMAQRVHDINPQCRIQLIDDFVEPGNVEQIFPPGRGVLVDCTDQVSAKVAMVLAARTHNWPIIVCGGAGGKTDPLSLRSGDLSLAAHDALLGRVRQVLRKAHNYPKGGAQGGKAHKRVPRMGVACLWFEQAVILPELWQQTSDDATLQGLSCAGYGSAVTVTASMGMAAAHQAIQHILQADTAHG